MKHYTLIVGSRFSLANDTDRDSQTDYFPGIWGIETQKSILRFSKERLAQGDQITVTDYDDPSYHALANSFIKALGLDQPLFTEPEGLKPTAVVTNGKPSSLGALKKYLVPGTKLTVINFRSDGQNVPRETFVKKLQTTSVILDKGGSNSYLDFGKADQWLFTNEDATVHYMDRDGKMVPQTKIIY